MSKENKSKERNESKVSYWIKKVVSYVVILGFVWAIVWAIFEFRFNYSQRKSPDLFLDYSQGIRSCEVSLELINKGDATAHNPNLAILIPDLNKGDWKITEFKFCQPERKSDTIIVKSFDNNTIRTYPAPDKNPSVNFRFTGINEFEVKQSNKSLKYIISCVEGKFIDSIQVKSIFIHN